MTAPKLVKSPKPPPERHPGAQMAQTPSPLPATPQEAFQYLLRQPIRHSELTSAPDFVPKNWAECFQVFDDGADRGLYIYINGDWRLITAT